MNKSDFDDLSDQSLSEATFEKNFEGIFEFDWKNKWLKDSPLKFLYPYIGDEYAHILQNIDSYTKRFNFMKYSKKTHPECIYTDPQNGMIYFVEGNSVGSEFGFPRVEIKKRYRWKKMNFTTDLPKSRPFVTYIVASAVKCEKFFPNSKNEGPSFRMHAVILNKNGLNSYREKINRKENPDNLKNLLDITKSTKSEPEYILCHIRKIDVDYKISKPHKVHNDNISDDEKQKKKLRKGKLEDLEDTHSKNLEKEEIKEIEQEVKQTDNLQKNTDESLRFRKMNVNTFQMYCVNQVVERDFANLVNEFCKTPAKKVKIYKENFFQEVIDKELNKKESNERDYAKMFNLMS